MTLCAEFFTAPSRYNFIILAYGWSLSSVRHTITTYLWLSGAVKYKHFSRFYYFLSGPFCKALESIWTAIIRHAARLIASGEAIRMKVDDTTKKKCGRKIEAAGNYRNGAGSARQEYRVLWGINFVYGIIRLPLRCWPGHFLSMPIGLRVYLKEELARKLGQPFRSRSALAREIIDLAAAVLADRRILVCGDGGYATKDFLRNLPKNLKVVSRFPINSKLYALPEAPAGGRVGRKPQKGQLIGKPKTLLENPKGWQAHPSEEGALIKVFTGLWHSVLPGVQLRMVIVLRKDYQSAPSGNVHPKSKKRELEAFFTTDLSLTVEEILNEYHDRWSIEIDIRDANAYYGLAQDQCRKYQRIVGINNFRMVMAALRTLWFINQVNQPKKLNLLRYRPWYQQKQHPTQLDVISACQEALYYQGISPTIRFIQDMREINDNQKLSLPPAA